MKKGLNEEDRKFLENMKGIREGEGIALSSVTMAKHKQKTGKVLLVEKRKHK